MEEYNKTVKRKRIKDMDIKNILKKILVYCRKVVLNRVNNALLKYFISTNFVFFSERCSF